jgi:uncharacterized protein with von Willebrand factor type A (vWA) domain
METPSSQSVENEPQTPQELAEFALRGAGVTGGPATFAQSADVLREIRLGATHNIQQGVDYAVYASAVSHAVELTHDPLLTEAERQLKQKMTAKSRRRSL